MLSQLQRRLVDRKRRRGVVRRLRQAGLLIIGVGLGSARGQSGRPDVRPRAESDEARACAEDAPLCVSARGRESADLAPALRAGALAWRTLTGPLEFPAPDASEGSRALEIVLAREEPDVSIERRDDHAYARLERASVRVRVNAERAGCELDEAMARAVALASLTRAAPRSTDAVARGQAAYLAQWIAPCALARTDDIDAYARAPSWPAVGPPGLAVDERARKAAHGARLFWWWLEERYARRPTELLMGLLAQGGHRERAPGEKIPKGASWKHDTMDVLRATFDAPAGQSMAYDEVLLAFAIERRLLTHDDRLRFSRVTRALASARITPHDWQIEWPSKPRRLASGNPLYPTGSSSIVVRVPAAKRAKSLRLDVEWEAHSMMRWAAIKRDGLGRALGRVDVLGPKKGTRAAATIVDLERTHDIMLVGVALGDPIRPYRASEGEPEPHAWIVNCRAAP